MRSDEGIFCVGVDQHATPLTVRESLAAGAGERLIPHLLKQGGASEVVFLSTCNRVEIYGRSSQRGPQIMESLIQAMPPELVAPWRLARTLYLHEGIACWRHLAEVATGLRSMVMGENEILGQVRVAYASARAQGGATRAMHTLFQSGLRAARAARSAAGFGKGDASVGRLAAEALHESMAGKDPRPLLLLGSGHTARSFAVVEHSRSQRPLWITSRSEDRARVLVQEVEGEFVPWSLWPKAVEAASVVVSALAGGELPWSAPLSSAGPELMIDLGVPRTLTAVRNSFPQAEWLDLEELARKTEIRPEALGSIHRAEEILRSHEALFALGKNKDLGRAGVGEG